jgi:hypothetical protein
VYQHPKTLQICIGAPGISVAIDGNYDRVGRVRDAAVTHGFLVFRGRDQKNNAFSKDWRHKDGFEKIYSEIEVIDHPDIVGGRRRIAVQVQFASARCEDIMEDIRAIEPAVWTWPCDVPEVWKKHMDSRVRSPSPDKDEWIYQQVSPEDHLRDCEKMHIGLVSAFGWIGDGKGIIEIGE